MRWYGLLMVGCLLGAAGCSTTVVDVVARNEAVDRIAINSGRSAKQIFYTEVLPEALAWRSDARLVALRRSVTPGLVIEQEHEMYSPSLNRVLFVTFLTSVAGPRRIITENHFTILPLLAPLVTNVPSAIDAYATFPKVELDRWLIDSDKAVAIGGMKEVSGLILWQDGATRSVRWRISALGNHTVQVDATLGRLLG